MDTRERRHHRIRPGRADRRGLHRARPTCSPLVIEGIGAGGQLMLTTDVENYPGFPDGILGPELMTKFREQAERFGAEFVTADADRVDFSASPLRVWVGDTEYTAHADHHLHRRHGPHARPRRPSSALLGHGVSTCATCDGFFFRGQNIAVVGGGDSALEEAIFLTTFADKVTLVHRRNELRGVEDHAGPRVREPEDRVPLEQRRRATSSATAGSRRSCCATPRPARPSDLAGDRPVRRDRPRPEHRSCSAASSTSTRTATSSPRPARRGRRSRACSRPATCRTTSYRQAITAAGTGCMAALEAERYLEALGDRATAGVA